MIYNYDLNKNGLTDIKLNFKLPNLFLIANILQIVVDFYFGGEWKGLLVHVGVHRSILLLISLFVPWNELKNHSHIVDIVGINSAAEDDSQERYNYLVALFI